MKWPTYSYKEMSFLISEVENTGELEIIRAILLEEATRYPLDKIQSLVRQVKIAAISLRSKS